MGALRCKILHVGKPRLPYVVSGIEHYRKKIQPYASLSLVAVREEPVRKGMGVPEIRTREGLRIQQQMGPRHLWIAMDPAGRTLDSGALASLVQDGMNQGHNQVAFVVGGPHGLAPEVLDRADLALSLSRMTFSHELTMLLLLEQIYRFLAVLNRLPYPR